MRVLGEESGMSEAQYWMVRDRDGRGKSSPEARCGVETHVAALVGNDTVDCGLEHELISWDQGNLTRALISRCLGR
jgi:hypothetical protein